MYDFLFNLRRIHLKTLRYLTKTIFLPSFTTIPLLFLLIFCPAILYVLLSFCTVFLSDKTCTFSIPVPLVTVMVVCARIYLSSIYILSLLSSVGVLSVIQIFHVPVCFGLKDNSISSLASWTSSTPI